MGVSQQKIDKDKMIREFDAIKNTDFGGWIFRWDIYPNDTGDSHGYEPSYDFKDILNEIEITDKDKIVDIGCGKGYAMYLLSDYNFGKIDGVELTKDLADLAEKNLATLFSESARYIVYNANILDWKEFDNYNYYYLCNPFGIDTTRIVAVKIKESADKTGEVKIVIYQMGEFPQVFLEIGFEQKIEKGKNVILTYIPKN